MAGVILRIDDYVNIGPNFVELSRWVSFVYGRRFVINDAFGMPRFDQIVDADNPVTTDVGVRTTPGEVLADIGSNFRGFESGPSPLDEQFNYELNFLL
jgi:hypothetical protein